VGQVIHSDQENGHNLHTDILKTHTSKAKSLYMHTNVLLKVIIHS